MAVTEEVEGGSPDTEFVAERLAIVELLTRAYWMEIEIVMNYIAATAGHRGARDLAVTAALTAGVEEEVAHARALGRRIQELNGIAPLTGGEQPPHPSVPSTDLATMIEAVIATESSAIRHYGRIIHATEGLDQDTSSLVSSILHDEERHLRLFEGYLREYRPQP